MNDIQNINNTEVYFTQLKGMKISIDEIPVGRIYDFCFDDSSWKIEDVIVKKGFGSRIREYTFSKVAEKCGCSTCHYMPRHQFP